MIKKTKRLTAVSLILIICISVGLFITLTRHKTVKPQESPVAVANQSINLKPPTDEEKKDTEDYKKSLVNGSDNSDKTSSSSSKKSVTPVITFVGTRDNMVVVNAYISGVNEDGGKCNVSFNSNNGRQFTKSTAGNSDASNTICSPITIAKSDFNPQNGTWSATLNYESSTSQGTSKASSFEL